MGALFWLIETIIQLAIIVLIVNAVLSWLFAFDVVSPRNRFMAQLYEFTQRLTRPMLEPLRRFIPPVGGVDLSPLVLILGLGFVSQLIPG